MQTTVAMQMTDSFPLMILQGKNVNIIQCSFQTVHFKLLQVYLKAKFKEWQYNVLFVVSGFIKKLFSVDCVNIYFSQLIVNHFFSIFFSKDLKVLGSTLLLVSWFINFEWIKFSLGLIFANRTFKYFACICFCKSKIMEFFARTNSRESEKLLTKKNQNSPFYHEMGLMGKALF